MYIRLLEVSTLGSYSSLRPDRLAKSDGSSSVIPMNPMERSTREVKSLKCVGSRGDANSLLNMVLYSMRRHVTSIRHSYSFCNLLKP